MSEDLKFAINTLIANDEWSALDKIANAFGGKVYDYINSHNNCPW